MLYVNGTMCELSLMSDAIFNSETDKIISFVPQHIGWEFNHPQGAGTFCLSYYDRVEELAPKPVGWIMCFLLMTLVLVWKPNLY